MTSTALVNNSAASIADPSSSLNKTYLQQCIEDLSPSNLSSLEWNSTLYRVASSATYVAFTVLAVGGIAAAAAFAPIYIPMIAISSILLLKFVQKGHDLLDEKADQARARAAQLKEIIRLHQQMSNMTLQQIQEALQQKGVQWFMIPGMMFNPTNLETLKPLIARHSFWEGYIQKLEEKKQNKIDEAAKAIAKNYADNKDTIYDLHCETLEIEKNILEAKVKNAFINAVLRRPDHIGTLDDLGSFSEVSGQERAMADAVSSTSLNDFFKFKKSAIPTIKVDEVRRMTISDLAMRLIAAMPN